MGLPSRAPPSSPAAWKDTLGIALQDGVVWVVGVLHGDGLRELAEHPLLEGFQPLVVVATAHVFFILSQGEHTLGPASTWLSGYSSHKPGRGAEAGPGQCSVPVHRGHWEVVAGRHKLLGGGGHPGRGARWG